MLRKWRKYVISVMTVIATIVLVTSINTSAESLKKFTDVNDRTVSTKSTQEAIYRLVEMNAIHGYKDGTFKPKRDIYRAQGAKILTGALGLSLPENLNWALKDYKDVGPNHEYAEFIAATTVTNMFKGDLNGNFNPWSPISRGQMAIVLGRVLKDYDTDKDVDVTLNNVWDEAKEGVQIIANLGVTTELADYRPYENVTRAQIAAFSIRVADVIDKHSDM